MAAKRSLVQAGGMIMALDRGLKTLASPSLERGQRPSEKLGEGELRRRRDLMATARKEKEALEALANSTITRKVEAVEVGGGSGSAAATVQQKTALFGDAANGPQPGLANGRSRRVLGAPLPDTERTRELDNGGVLQLQKQVMKDQDQSLDDMTKGVLRLKELGVAINEELQVQNSMMGLLSEDVTRCVVIMCWKGGRNIRS